MVEHYFDDQEPIAMKNTKGEVLPLREYLETVARLTEQFAGKFGCAKQGYILGLHHAIGMYSSPFQRAVWDEKKPVPSFRKGEQATASAKELAKISPSYLPLAMAAAGQYSFLADYGHPRLSTAGDGTFCGRLKTETPDISIWKQELDTEGIEAIPTRIFAIESSINLAFYTRMMYSCLVDAVRIVTQGFLNSTAMPQQTGEDIVAATYPTGKDKKLERIIYVVPSAVEGEVKKEQLSKLIDADLFPDMIYLEGEDPEETATWDAPIVITTQQSFYRTLYGAEKDVVIKLHNTAKAAIIVEDPYTIPTGIVTPFLKALSQLTAHYGAVVKFTGIATALAPFEREVPQKDFQLISAVIPDLGKETFKYIKVEKAKVGEIDVNRIDLLLLHLKERPHQGRAVIDISEDLAPKVEEELKKIYIRALRLTKDIRESEVADQLIRAAEVVITTPSTRHLLALSTTSFPVVYCEESAFEDILQMARYCDNKLYLLKKETLDPAKAFKIGWMRETVGKFNNPLTNKALDFYFKRIWIDQAIDQDKIISKHEGGCHGYLPFKTIGKIAARTADLMYGAD